ncbi:MAG: (2Fe-2S)-binding protein [Chloroflexi bacterium]|nr:(2Fe-2S)-binding protein [Chloroflexota bacterium]
MELFVNGDNYEVAVEPATTLLSVLRDQLRLTGTKKGCGHGACGSCTVLLDGKPVNSCLVLAWRARDKTVLTIEGLTQGRDLHPLQKAFLEHGAVQCGYCTPGTILSAKALLDSNPQPTEREVRLAISGNLCRCTGYAKSVEAILAAAAEGR